MSTVDCVKVDIQNRDVISPISTSYFKHLRGKIHYYGHKWRDFTGGLSQPIPVGEKLILLYNFRINEEFNAEEEFKNICNDLDMDYQVHRIFYHTYYKYAILLIEVEFSVRYSHSGTVTKYNLGLRYSDDHSVRIHPSIIFNYIDMKDYYNYDLKDVFDSIVEIHKKDDCRGGGYEYGFCETTEKEFDSDNTNNKIIITRVHNSHKSMKNPNTKI